MKLNILNKQGLLNSEDRKQPFSYSGNYLTFNTCLDLSEPILITTYIDREITLNEYSNELSAFISYWSKYVKDDLNGFNGFSNIKFVIIDFKIKTY